MTLQPKLGVWIRALWRVAVLLLLLAAVRELRVIEREVHGATEDLTELKDQSRSASDMGQDALESIEGDVESLVGALVK